MAITESSLARNGTYTFTMAVPTIMGNAFNAAKLVGFVDYNTAKATSTDIAAEHLKQYPQLPQGTDSNPENLSYIIILTNLGTRRALALDWIQSATLITQQSATVSIGSINQDQIAQLRSYLQQNAISFTITIG